MWDTLVVCVLRPWSPHNTYTVLSKTQRAIQIAKCMDTIDQDQLAGWIIAEYVNILASFPGFQALTKEETAWELITNKLFMVDIFITWAFAFSEGWGSLPEYE